MVSANRELVERMEGRIAVAVGRVWYDVAVGRTRNGRCIKVVYIPDPEPGSVFVVTAYELTGNALSAYRRRNR